MSTAAVICEYNPFHAGHAYHLEQTRKSGATHIICIMSGPFTQRGEVAIASKWTRARHALMRGADVVLELPCLFSLQSAEGFALGGVRIADAVHADYLSFGAEENRLNVLEYATDVLGENETNSQILHQSQKQGESYARAKQRILESYAPDLSSLLNGPNNILALEYMQAIRKIGSSMRPLAILRPYPPDALKRDERGPVHTSFSIRSGLRRSSDTDRILLDSGCPEAFTPVFAADKLFTLLMYLVRTTDDLERYALIHHPLAKRLQEAAQTAQNYESLIDAVSTRFLPRARVKRALMHLALQTDKDTLVRVNDLKSPLHARILGYRSQSKAFLSGLIRKTDIPLVMKFGEYPETELAKADLRASDIYTLFENPSADCAYDKAHFPIIV